MPVRSLVPSFSPRLWAVIGFVLLLVSLSNDSIDMDEAQTWDYARLDTFPEFCHELKNDKNSESQMPLGMFSFWAWARAFGTGELAMRSLNLLWAALTLVALARAGRRLSIPWLPLLFAIQPLTWYCMNQARTPLMQMAGGALLLAGSLGYFQRRQIGGICAAYLCAGAILLCGASMLGLIPSGAVCGGLAAHGVWRRVRLPIAGKILAFLTATILAALGIYYGLTLLRGAGGVKIWSVSPANMFFAGYEFLGFQGFGPGRQELRAIMKGFVPAGGLLLFAPGFLVLASAYFLVLASAYKSWMTRDFHPVVAASRHAGGSDPAEIRSDGCYLFPAWLLGIGVTILSVGLLFVLAFIVGFPFWGRHLAGAFPFWVLALAVTIHWARQGVGRKAGRAAGVGVLLLLLASSLLLRFASFHRHDDYRGAVAEALRASSGGGIVWWVADHSGGAYYGLPLADEFTGKPGEIQFAMNRSSIPQELPGAVIISRPDNFDVKGTASQILAAGSYRRIRKLQSFEVWEK